MYIYIWMELCISIAVSGYVGRSREAALSLFLSRLPSPCLFLCNLESGTVTRLFPLSSFDLLLGKIFRPRIAATQEVEKEETPTAVLVPLLPTFRATLLLLTTRFTPITTTRQREVEEEGPAVLVAPWSTRARTQGTERLEETSLHHSPRQLLAAIAI